MFTFATHPFCRNVGYGERFPTPFLFCWPKKETVSARQRKNGLWRTASFLVIVGAELSCTGRCFDRRYGGGDAFVFTGCSSSPAPERDQPRPTRCSLVGTALVGITTAKGACRSLPNLSASTRSAGRRDSGSAHSVFPAPTWTIDPASPTKGPFLWNAKPFLLGLAKEMVLHPHSAGGPRKKKMLATVTHQLN